MSTQRVVSLALCILFAPAAVHVRADASLASESQEQRSERIPIIVKSQSDIQLGAAHLDSISEFRRVLKARADANPRLAVLISVPVDEKFGLTILILDECRRAGVTDIKIDRAPESLPKPRDT